MEHQGTTTARAEGGNHFRKVESWKCLIWEEEVKESNLPVGWSFWGLEVKGDGGMTTSPASSARDSKHPSFSHFGFL